MPTEVLMHTKNPDINLQDSPIHLPNTNRMDCGGKMCLLVKAL